MEEFGVFPGSDFWLEGQSLQMTQGFLFFCVFGFFFKHSWNPGRGSRAGWLMERPEQSGSVPLDVNQWNQARLLAPLSQPTVSLS